MNLGHLLERIQQAHGYQRETLFSLRYEGLAGQALIQQLMARHRTDFPDRIGTFALTELTDFQEGTTRTTADGSVRPTSLPASNALRLRFGDMGWYALRPSGTEPKIKIYIYTYGKTASEAEQYLQLMEQTVRRELSAPLG